MSYCGRQIKKKVKKSAKVNKKVIDTGYIVYIIYILINTVNKTKQRIYENKTKN
jgi:hypothetical protein